MERVTISVSNEFAEQLKDFMTRQGYANRSEALRDLARSGLQQAKIGTGASCDCIAVLSYVYNHHTRDLSKRLTVAHHANHNLQLATLHVHLDHNDCLEVAVLRGQTEVVKSFARDVISETGVHHGHVSLVPISFTSTAHAHEHGNSSHKHAHIHPLV